MLQEKEKESKITTASIYFVVIRKLWLQMFISPQWGQLRQLGLISTLTILNDPLPGAGQLILYLELWSWARRACTPECIETFRSGRRWIITVLNTPYRRRCQQNSLGIKVKIVLALHRALYFCYPSLPEALRDKKNYFHDLEAILYTFLVIHFVFSLKCTVIDLHGHF